VAVDSSGNVYISDTGNSRVQKFSPDGNFLKAWGSDGSGAGQFREPLGIAVDLAGNVYVADSANQRVQKFSSDGNFLASWTGFEFWRLPAALAVDGSGYVYVVDSASATGSLFEKFSRNGDPLTAWYLSLLPNATQSTTQKAIAVDTSGILYVAFDGRIQKQSSQGKIISTWLSADLEAVTGLATDTLGNLYTVNASGYVHKLNGEGTSEVTWRLPESGSGLHVRGLAVDAGGNVYVADSGANSILKFSSEPNKLHPSPDALAVGAALSVLAVVSIATYALVRFRRSLSR